ncbi:hypothetical protein Enr10x_26700 [Gimesia panareensis]|uniref:Uncharacterized protein n=1 Tax=Gimesia panareensis TaxID=2527978 RepID=A0A517Q6W9_9PLAN|nr:hypothetical protein [Gimesia panareensis]QDT27353.1 hypothetical protein Enr10x_26700 [Gimesia panareensis]
MESIWQILVNIDEFLIIGASLAGLVFVLTWPRVRGKGLMAGGLGLILISELRPLLVPLFAKWFDGQPLMGPDEYRDFWYFSFFMLNLSVLGKILLAVAVFQLRGGLRSEQSLRLNSVETGDD